MLSEGGGTFSAKVGRADSKFERRVKVADAALAKFSAAAKKVASQKMRSLKASGTVYKAPKHVGTIQKNQTKTEKLHRK
jgi:hypothetical protein